VRWALGLLLAACGPVGEAPRAACDGTIADASWLRGSWHGDDGEAEEHWTAAAGGTMLGVGRTIVGDTTRSFEFMRIEARPAGLVFIAQPSGGPAVEFTASTCAPDLLRFENPAHDFPKSIEYRRDGADAITATVDAPGGPTLQFVFRREAPR
jgi:hypothetical protein